MLCFLMAGFLFGTSLMRIQFAGAPDMIELLGAFVFLFIGFLEMRENRP